MHTKEVHVYMCKLPLHLVSSSHSGRTGSVLVKECVVLTTCANKEASSLLPHWLGVSRTFPTCRKCIVTGKAVVCCEECIGRVHVIYFHCSNS